MAVGQAGPERVLGHIVCPALGHDVAFASRTTHADGGSVCHHCFPRRSNAAAQGPSNSSWTTLCFGAGADRSVRLATEVNIPTLCRTSAASAHESSNSCRRVCQCAAPASSLREVVRCHSAAAPFCRERHRSHAMSGAEIERPARPPSHRSEVLLERRDGLEDFDRVWVRALSQLLPTVPSRAPGHGIIVGHPTPCVKDPLQKGTRSELPAALTAPPTRNRSCSRILLGSAADRKREGSTPAEWFGDLACALVRRRESRECPASWRNGQGDASVRGGVSDQ